MEKQVTVYGTTSCPYCMRAKEFLHASSIAFTDYNVAVDKVKAQEMIDKSGQMGVPVLDIGGEIIVGFDVNRIRAALGLSS